MICAETKLGAVHPPNRRELACERLVVARAALCDCRLCPHNCGVNRFAGERGRCRADANARVFSAQIEVGDELELIPTFAVAFNGCDMRCAFCVTGADSWNAHRGEPFDAPALAAMAEDALETGARTVMILGGEPTIHLPSAIELVAMLPSAAKIVWKTNGYMTGQSRALTDGLFDVWLVDYKFGNDSCAARLAGVESYQVQIQDSLTWAERRSELVVRHLLMPGHVECCWKPIAQWLAMNLPTTKVSLRCGYWPAWKASRHIELLRTVNAAEERRATDIARAYGLHLIE
jgi:putative pyruvate formate lyase activating enzyme